MGNKVVFAIFWLSLVVLTGCTGLSDRFQATPTAISASNTVVVIADEALWTGIVGDTFRYKYEGPYLIMPQPEEIFDLKYFTPEQVEQGATRKELRTYIYLADLSDTSSTTTRQVRADLGAAVFQQALVNDDVNNKVGKDKWAHGQMIIYIFGNGKDKLIHNIENTFSAVRQKVNAFDRPQIIAKTYLKGINQLLSSGLQKKFGFSMDVPGEYVLAVEDSTTTWMRRDEKEMIMNILVSKVPYRSKDQFTNEGFKELTKNTAKRVISTSTPGSTLVINDEDLPMFSTPITLDNTFTQEFKGIWEMSYDYMGGPFFGYLIKHPHRDELVLINVFIFAPGQNKRDYMQQLEQVVSTIKFLPAG